MENPNFQFEGSYFVGIVLSAILYGVYLGICYLSLCSILGNANITYPRRIFYISYSITLLLLNMLFFPTPLFLGQKTWVEYRGYLGGPSGYYLSQATNVNYMVMGHIAQNLIIFLSDALLVYRCYIIFGSRLRFVIIPALCVIGTLGIMMATIPLGLGQRVRTSLEDRVDAAGIVLAVITNVMVTAMISTKILSMYYRIRDYVEYETTRPYTNVVTILVESAAPSAVLGVLSTILMLRQSIMWYMSVLLVWSTSIALLSQLIILRTATGVAWSNKDSSSYELSVITV